MDLVDLLSFRPTTGLPEESDPTAFSCGDLELVRPHFLVAGGEGEGDRITLFLEVPAVSGESSLLDCWVKPDNSTEGKVRGEAGLG